MNLGAALPSPTRVVGINLPAKLGFLLQPHRYKVAYGGRGSAKSHSFARALLALGATKRLRILCAREVQKSIENSVYRLLCDLIREMGLQSFYRISETEIVGGNGTAFLFSGLSQHTVDSIKSFEGVDIVWVEEGQTVTKRSWDILIPTIRKPGSEIWVSFNPDLETDDTFQRFVVMKPPGAIVVLVNWSDNPWFPDVLEAERAYMERTAPDDYENIWMGKCRKVIAGAIYTREISDMINEGRYRPVPYDPRLPVHCIWDLGWNDAMAITMVQKPIPTVVNIINYLEDKQRTYAEYVGELEKLGYRYGDDWLPHDGENKNPQTGKSPKQILQLLRRQSVKIIGRSDANQGIQRVRMMMPRVYLDNSSRKVNTGFLGAARLYDCMRFYRRKVTMTTGEEGEPLHDQYSHGCDSVRGLATIVDQIRNDLPQRTRGNLPGFTVSDPGLGALG